MSERPESSDPTDPDPKETTPAAPSVDLGGIDDAFLTLSEEVVEIAREELQKRREAPRGNAPDDAPTPR